MEVRLVGTYRSRDQPPSAQSLVAEGYFARSFVVFVPDLSAGHLLPCQLAVAAQARTAPSTYSGCWTQQSMVESQGGFVSAVWATAGPAMSESLDVRKDAARDARAGILDPLCRCQGCLSVEDERFGRIPAGYCTAEERLRGTVE